MADTGDTYWVKQTATQPVYPDLVWSKPENKAHAGKLLIVSGNAAGFAVAAQAYGAAQAAGAGTVRVILPDNLRRQMPKEVQFELDFAPSVIHGSFSKTALSDLLGHSNWADIVLLPGGIGRNSETSTVLDGFVTKYSGLLTLAEDALDVFVHDPGQLFGRNDTIVIADFSQLQKVWHKVASGLPALTYSLPLQLLVELLHKFSLQIAPLLVVNHQNMLLVAYRGKVSSTPSDEAVWRVQVASTCAVWAMQHTNKLFESVTTALVHPVS